MNDNFIWTGLTISLLIAAVAVYVILYLFKWTKGGAIWQGILVSLVWVFSTISLCFLGYIIGEVFRLQLRSSFIITSALCLSIPTLLIIAILGWLRRFRKESEASPQIIRLSLIIGILAFAIFAGGMRITMEAINYFYPPPSEETGE